LDRAREQFEAAGVRLVLIGQATPRQAAHFRRRLGLSLAVLADEQRVSYRAAGARMAGVGELVGPKVLAKGIATAVRSRQLQGRTVGHPAQLGGAMVVLPGGRVAWRRMAADARDNAEPEEILRFAQGARMDGPSASP
jgi:uncharacterized protein YigA (DUF484 family)